MDVVKLHAEGRKFKIKDGREVRILCTNRDSEDYPIVAITGTKDSAPLLYTKEGQYFKNAVEEHAFDLILVPSTTEEIDELISKCFDIEKYLPSFIGVTELNDKQNLRKSLYTVRCDLANILYNLKLRNKNDQKYFRDK